MPNVLIVLIFIEALKVASQITYQNGYSNAFYYQGNLNLYDSQEAGRTLSVQYEFRYPFERVPQIYLVLNQIEQENAYPVGYYLDVNSITTSGFTITVTVPHTNRYYGIIFSWHAFDDQRRIIISAFNYQNPQPSYTFSHSNLNFEKAVVSLVSFVVESRAYLDINIQVDSITQNSVTVQILANQELTYIGFQILIGIQQSIKNYPNFEYLGEQKFVDNPSNWSQTECILGIQSFIWNGDTNLRLKSSVVYYDFGVILSSETWDDSYLNSLNFWCSFIVTQWEPEIVNPMLYFSYFLQKLPDIENLQTTKLTIVPITLEQNQSETFIMDKSTEVLVINIIIKCANSNQLQMTVINCLNKYNTYVAQCSKDSDLNTIKYTIQFRQSEQVYKKFTASFTENQIEISQNIIDYEEKNFLLLNLKL